MGIGILKGLFDWTEKYQRSRRGSRRQYTLRDGPERSLCPGWCQAGRPNGAFFGWCRPRGSVGSGAEPEEVGFRVLSGRLQELVDTGR